MRKLHALFVGGGGYYDAIVPTKDQESGLRVAKNKIRDHLLRGIKTASTEQLGMPKEVTPRFKTQGSWAYRACVQPAHTIQEMDWDYGVYLPVQAWEEKATPKVVAAVYFDLVEQLLEELCQKEHWELGEEKKHCIRVLVADGAHVDVALYAAPEDKFSLVNDRQIEFADSQHAMDSVSKRQLLAEAYEIEPEQDWDEFDDFMVATRDGVWERSDAEAIAHWFRDQVKVHGEQLRHIWRYLKAWRDYQWANGGPSSVLLMLAATRHFKKWEGRDDRSLAAVVPVVADAMLHDYFEDGIDPGHNFNSRMEPAQKLDAYNQLTALAATLDRAIDEAALDKPSVLTVLRNEFGPRLPNRESDVVDEQPADRVRSVPARVVAAPKIDRSYAG